MFLSCLSIIYCFQVRIIHIINFFYYISAFIKLYIKLDNCKNLNNNFNFLIWIIIIIDIKNEYYISYNYHRNYFFYIIIDVESLKSLIRYKRSIYSFDNGKYSNITDNVGEPGEILDFSNEVGFEELVHFFSDRFASFFSYLYFLL